jgi:hypothetical protein
MSILLIVRRLIPVSRATCLFGVPFSRIQRRTWRHCATSRYIKSSSERGQICAVLPFNRLGHVCLGLDEPSAWPMRWVGGAIVPPSRYDALKIVARWVEKEDKAAAQLGAIDKIDNGTKLALEDAVRATHDKNKQRWDDAMDDLLPGVDDAGLYGGRI